MEPYRVWQATGKDNREGTWLWPVSPCGNRGPCSPGRPWLLVRTSLSRLNSATIYQNLDGHRHPRALFTVALWMLYITGRMSVYIHERCTREFPLASCVNRQKKVNTPVPINSTWWDSTSQQEYTKDPKHVSKWGKTDSKASMLYDDAFMTFHNQQDTLMAMEATQQSLWHRMSSGRWQEGLSEIQTMSRILIWVVVMWARCTCKKLISHSQNLHPSLWVISQ